MLANEFQVYQQALSLANQPQVRTSEDVERDWKMFCMNYISIKLLRRNQTLLTKDENEAVEKCVAIWFEDI